MKKCRFFVFKIKIGKMAGAVYLTKEGLKSLRDELEDLTGRARTDIAKQIGEARDKGDLSENAEYDAAKDAQGLLELKISKLQATIANAKVIDETKLDTSKVMIMAKVKIKNLSNKMEITYTLVPEQEANLKEGKIATSTPIGQALMGKKVGDVVEVKVPAGDIKFELLDISI